MAQTVMELVQSLEKGGRTKRIVETAARLRHHGWRVKILSMTPVPAWVRDRFHADSDWLELNRRPKLDLAYVFRLARLIRQERISLIHAHCEASYLYGGLAGLLCQIPVVGTYHRSDLKYFAPSPKLRLFARLLTRSVAISNDRMELMQSQLNIAARRISLIHGGVDLRQFHVLSAEQTPSLKQQLGLPGKKLILSIGHLGPIKGHDVSLRALPHILERHPDLLWVIAGDGSEEDYARLHKLVRELKLEDNVRLLGQVHNVLDWLQACDLFVQPSLEEGFGLVFVEAGACGKAVVSTAVGGIKDIVLHEQTGLLVAPGDALALAQAVDSLLADPNRARAMGAAGWQRIHDCFTLESMGVKYDQLFTALLGSPTHGGAGPLLN